MLLLSRSLDQIMAFFSNSPLTLLVSIDNAMFPVPPGEMTLSYRVAKQPQEWVIFFMFNVAVPLLEATKVCVNSVPSKTGEKVCEISLKWITGPYSDAAGDNRLPYMKMAIMQRRPT